VIALSADALYPINVGALGDRSVLPLKERIVLTLEWHKFHSIFIFKWSFAIEL
jgi:hypothetical protein